MSDLLELPDEIVESILCEISVPELCRIGQVNHRLNELMHSEEFWETFAGTFNAQDILSRREQFSSWRECVIEAYLRGDELFVFRAWEKTIELDREFRVNIMIDGSRGCGKRMLRNTFRDGSFIEQTFHTIDVDFGLRRVLYPKIDSVDMRTLVLAWNYPHYHKAIMPPSVFRRMNGLIICINPEMSMKESERVITDTYWERRKCGEIIYRTVLVATKCDLPEATPEFFAQASALARKLGIPFLRCSSKRVEGVDAVFRAVMDLVFAYYKKHPDVTPSIDLRGAPPFPPPPPPPEKKGFPCEIM